MISNKNGNHIESTSNVADFWLVMRFAQDITMTPEHLYQDLQLQNVHPMWMDGWMDGQMDTTRTNRLKLKELLKMKI
jgi:hypothetical protein